MQREDEEKRMHLSAIVYWQTPEGPSHCLMQAVLVPERILKVFLAELKTCPPRRGLFMDPAGAANAAWDLIRSHLGDIDRLEVEWLFRSGEYSSYDPGYFDTLTHYNLSCDSEQRWIYEKYDNWDVKPEEESRIRHMTNVTDVEADLAKLPPPPRFDPGEY